MFIPLGVKSKEILPFAILTNSNLNMPNMKSAIISVIGAAALTTAAPLLAKRDVVYGFDISHYQYASHTEA